MAVRKKGNQWQADFMVKGERHRRSFDTEAAAEAWELQARAALKLGKPIPDEETKRQGGKDRDTLKGLLRDTIALHWKLKGKGACKQVVNAEVFVRWCGEDMSVDDAFEQDNIDKFVAYLIEVRKASNGTLNRY